jgi:hypothetical protein
MFILCHWAEVRECLDLHPSRLEIYTVGKATVFCAAVYSDRQVQKFKGISSLPLHGSTKLLDVTSKVAIYIQCCEISDHTTRNVQIKTEVPKLLHSTLCSCRSI